MSERVREHGRERSNVRPNVRGVRCHALVNEEEHEDTHAHALHGHGHAQVDGGMTVGWEWARPWATGGGRERLRVRATLRSQTWHKHLRVFSVQKIRVGVAERVAL